MNTTPIPAIPGYAIVREIGKGGMATVYLAIQERLERQVALKVMNAALAADGNFTERFIKEGRLIDQLRHPLIIPLFEFNHHAGHYYFSMEFLPGGTLSQKIQQGIEPDRALSIARRIAEALAHAHQRNIIHRDIKPQNVLFRQDDTPVLSDFGIAKVVDTEATNLTQLGMVIGSLRYMSPEQAASKPLDARSDLYSLGIVLYEMLTKTTPYQPSDIFNLAMLLGTGQIPALPEELRRFQPLLNRLLALQPDDRFASAEHLIRALDQFRGGQTAPLAASLPPSGTLSAATLPAADGAAPLLGPRSTATAPTVEKAPKVESQAPVDPAPRARKSSRLAGGLLLTAVIGLVLVILYLLAMRPTRPPNIATAPGPAQRETPPPGVQPQVEQLLEQARTRRKQGALAESLDLIEQGLRLAPQQLDLLTLRAQVKIELDYQNRTADLLRDCATRFAPDRLAEQDQDAAASGCYDRVLQLDPANPAALAQQARIGDQLADWADAALGQNDLGKARAYLTRLSRLRPDHPRLAPLNQNLQAKVDQAAEAQRQAAEAARRQEREAARRQAVEEQAKRKAAEEQNRRRAEEATKRKPVEPARSAASAETRRKSAPTADAGKRGRCGNILSRITLGEPVSSADQAFLNQECR